MIDKLCPHCEQPFVEQLYSYGISFFCPPCAQIHQLANFAANSPALAAPRRQEARAIAAVAWNIGMLVLCVAALQAAFEQ